MSAGKTDASGNYAKLGSFAGLSSNPRERKDSSSEDQSESIISSLSSHSHETSPNHSSAQNRKRLASYESADDHGLDQDNIEDDMAGTEERARERPAKADEAALFSRIFCLNSHAGREHTILKDKVRVTSTLSHGSLFKDRTRAVQTIQFHEGAIWTMKFSPTGAHLCTAGQNTQVVVWCVGGLPIAVPNEDSNNDGAHEMHEPHEKQPQQAQGNQSMNVTHFLHPEPYRVLEGHSSDVIDVAWSKLEFLLSASTDKTVRLWHVRTSDCLQYFRHPDIVTAVEFHPLQDRYYISGCFDRKLRVWDIIPDPTVLEWTQTTDTITSVCFSPDGKMVAGGLIQGKVYFYDLVDYDQLKYKTQMECRNRGGKHSGGTKVTGMCYQPAPSMGGNKAAQSSTERDHRSSGRRTASLLVTTNDSRIRLCDLGAYAVEKKFKGLHNTRMQIRASFSDDAERIISGSEDGAVHIWSVDGEQTSVMASMMGRRSDRNHECESFDASSNNDVAAPVAVFAPVEALGFYFAYRHAEEEVTLASPTTAKGASSSTAAAVKTSKLSGAAPFSRTSTSSAESYGVEPSSGTAEPAVAAQVRRAEDLKSYSSRVIVTGDCEGNIRVFFRLG